ncbi:hypothetical protein IAG44_25285 [Streptomyces roseirectus]|uniref:Uncharacterized protein n=1 Tax=Streptomyces roseirectus TaxID=2768066 RepID=A0A7H0IHZ0_9ACTN|nr:hypothetical protein [Streptomyces roseirectus]QNP72406.1 hypothetical protein IAG44_25285 [Streptomyces roseirectus]
MSADAVENKPAVAAGKDLETAGMAQVAQGITQTLDELREIGVDSLAGAGRGFSELALTGLELGHDELRSEFSSFCERWDWGVRSLVFQANAFAQSVGLAAGLLHETDQYVSGSVKVLANSVVGGSPYATEEEVQGKSWRDIAFSQYDALSNPDYSKESLDKAVEAAKQGWKDAGRDVMTSETMGPLGPLGPTPEGLRRAAGIGEGDYEQMLDHTFGPSPEERARQQEGQTG